MVAPFNTYESLKKLRNSKMPDVAKDPNLLNQFHDELMQEVVLIAKEKMKEEWGTPPTSSTFFVMGSAGRFEQAICSDQDHGMIYEQKSERAKEYFQKLGQEIAKGLEIVGYPLCDGNVMCSNLLWCKSIEEWQEQLLNWMKEEKWSSIRNLLIFLDARALVGNAQHVYKLKCFIYEYIEKTPHLLQRMLENTMHIKKGVGLFGQFLVETHGSHTGSINLKETAFFPYVCAIRLLSVKEKIIETSTLMRLHELLKLKPYQLQLRKYERHFQQLLDYRLMLQGQQDDYDSVHYLTIDKLTKDQKQEMKKILQDGPKLYEYMKSIIEKGC